MQRVALWGTITASLLAFPGLVGAGLLHLTWTDNATNEAGFMIERVTESSTGFAEIGRVGPNLTSYGDASAVDGVTYCYRVRAFNLAGLSSPSNAACGTAPASSPAPILELNVVFDGPTMIVTATLAPGILPVIADAYVVLQAPDGALLSLVGANTLAPGILSVTRGFVPVPFFGEIFRYTFTGGEPAGTYHWFAGLTQAGTSTLLANPVEAVFVR
jgi:hypothetical protein